MPLHSVYVHQLDECLMGAQSVLVEPASFIVQIGRVKSCAFIMSPIPLSNVDTRVAFHLALRKAKQIKFGFFFNRSWPCNFSFGFLTFLWYFWASLALKTFVCPFCLFVSLAFSTGRYRSTTISINDGMCTYTHLPLPYAHCLTNGYLLNCQSQCPVASL